MLKNLTRACLLAVLHLFPVVAWAQNSVYGMTSDDAAVKSVGFLLISVIIAIVVFLILREIVCWYWKLNQIVNNLKEINTNIRDLRQEMSGSSKVSSSNL